MAKKTAASAAARTITNKAIICPSIAKLTSPATTVVGDLMKREKAIKLILHEFSINSIPINIVIAFRRVKTAKTPSVKRIELINK